MTEATMIQEKCRHDYKVHVLDELGNAKETRCEDCGGVLATQHAGHWFGPDGQPLPAAPGGSVRPIKAHTCGLSSLPCAACYRDRYGQRGQSRLRRALSRMSRPIAG